MESKEKVISAQKAAVHSGSEFSSSSFSSQRHSSTQSKTHYSNGSTTFSSSPTNGSANGTFLLKDVVLQNFLIKENVSREDEKSYFDSLNARLAAYIQKVHSLNVSRDKLVKTIDEYSFTETILKQRLDELYRYELDIIDANNDKLKNLLIEISTLTIELEKVTYEYNSQQGLVAKLTADLKAVEQEIREAQEKIKVLTSVLAKTQRACDDAEKINGEREKKQTTFQKNLNELYFELEQAVAEYTKWEADCVATQKKIDLTNETHEQIMKQYSGDIKLEFETIVNKVQNDYDEILVRQIQALKDDFHHRLEVSNNEFAHFKFDLRDIKFDGSTFIADANAARKEATKLQNDIIELEATIKSHELEIAKLKHQVSELEIYSITIHESEYYKQRIIAFEREVNALRQQYFYFLELKLQLDSEINAYNVLLGGEEYRLSIFRVEPVEDHTGRSFVSKGHSHKDLVIDEINMNGNYIHLTNKGKNDFNLASWTITAEANNNGKTRTFKFTSNLVVAPGKSVTVWSANCNEGTNNPPESIQTDVNWPSGDRIHVTLLDEYGKKQAWLTAYYEVDYDHHHDHHHH